MDTGTLNLLGIIVNTAGLIFVAYITHRGTNKTASKIAEVSQNNSIENKTIADKVDVVHKEVNGRMDELLSTTKEIAEKKGKADEKADQKLKDGKK